MCIGSSSILVEVWEQEGTPVGRLADGHAVSLAFLPEAQAGDVVLLHLGIPVEVLVPATTEPEGVST